jgi:glycosyltransferase involved in cell wall biosynthesis
MPAFTPTLSVVVPVYNGAETISMCLESLLNQTYPAEKYEIIVVENGSTDGTGQVVKRYPVRLFQSKERGPASARNLGVAESRADIIAFTDADCVADPNWLSELVRPYADPEVGGVCGAILAYEHPDRTLVELFSDKHSPLVNYISGEHEFFPHLYTANASYRHCLLRDIGGFNPRLLTAEDVDLAWRLQLEKKIKVCYVPEAIIYHRHRTTGTDLARLYRHYGLGEIMLDTLYGKYPGYPRDLRFQMRRISGQVTALPRYLLSIAIRQIRLMNGRATPYEALEPRLWFLIESNNIRGKIEGLWLTRLMTDVQPFLKEDTAKMITRLYGDKKVSAVSKGFNK